MRLLHVKGDAWGDGPLDISLCDTIGVERPPYMILSHRWRNEEVSFSDMDDSDTSKARRKRGFSKIEASCRKALQQNLEYVWVDTCCIDKSSSAELSEAINSMYNWYAQSAICFAYLDDVEDDTGMTCQPFKESEWFTRGWTLQELIAPKQLHFYSRSWTSLGTRSLSCKELAIASGVAKEVLLDPNTLHSFSVAEKMSWASNRNTTRGEDEAYSLMGLFGVNMPPLYGEGQRNAFRRLQVEIMHTTYDHTLFAWNQQHASGDMLAPNARSFIGGSRFKRMDHAEFINIFQLTSPKLDYAMTNIGLHIQLPMCPVPRSRGLYFAYLACKTKDGNNNQEKCMAICLRVSIHHDSQVFQREAFLNRTIHEFQDVAVHSLIPMLAWISESTGSAKVSTITSKQQISSLRIGFRPFSMAHADKLVPVDAEGAYFRVGRAYFSGSRNLLFTLNDTQNLYVVIGFVGLRVWICAGELDRNLGKEFDRHKYFERAFSFPFGASWQDAKASASINFLDEEFLDYTSEHRGTVERSLYTSTATLCFKFSISSSELRILCSSTEKESSLRPMTSGPKMPMDLPPTITISVS